MSKAINACASLNNLDFGQSVHGEMVKLGPGFSDVILYNSLVDMYVKCGSLVVARQVFDRMNERNVVSWTSMISGFLRNGASRESMELFSQLIRDCVWPNEFTMAVLLRACAQVGELKKGQSVHAYLIRNWCFESGFLENSLIDMYIKCGSLVSAQTVFDRMGFRDVVSWTCLIDGFVVNGLIDEALMLFHQMGQEKVTPNSYTVSNIIRACAFTEESFICKWIHGFVMKKPDLWSNLFVMNSLIEMYARIELMECAHLVFDKLPEKNRESWDAIVAGSARSESAIEALQMLNKICSMGEYLCPETMASLLQCCDSLKEGKGIHGYLVKHGYLPFLMIENSLMDMYSKHGEIDPVRQLFLEMPKRDIVSWNTLILCYVHNGHTVGALELFAKIHRRDCNNIRPDSITMLVALQGCAQLASLHKGEIIHAFIMKSGLEFDIYIGNSLIDMYAKSGRLDLSEQVFTEMPGKDLGSWNSMISAYGTHGYGNSSLELFNKMQNLGIQEPDQRTLVCVLSACVHSGLIEHGLNIFESMFKKFGIKPGIEHYGCVVDLLGRSGQVKEAEQFLNKMGMRPNASLWGALLGACHLHREVEVAERVAERIEALEPENATWKVVLSNIYAGAGRWADALKLRAEMKSEGLHKEAGWSCVEVRGNVHRFMVGDTKHPDSERIYEILGRIREEVGE
ncbi:pentatricopeptide repeat-containing protein At3g57430, chloroplastic [Amborella trichopoda]|nr:pentatricopeptide repeat-containing protein At3g57430, chloroplastic [Amborella trichopoda]|eukprot:XP_006829023.2 pentatricopeptide repeat-containing protein At3g57430, chloroplastic [Amborella trichopoda]